MLVVAALVAATSLLTAPRTFAQASYTGDYTQNFSSMGTGTVAPLGWSVESEAGANSTFAASNDSTPGTYTSINFTAGAITTQAIKQATPNPSSLVDSAGGYNWTNTAANIAAGEGTESLGSDPTGTAGTILELSLTNNTGSAISAVNISYDIDRFSQTNSNNGAGTGSPNAGVEEFPGYQLFYNLTPSNTATWVNVSALNPTIDNGTTGAVQVPNSVGITQVGTAADPNLVTLDSAWAAGTTISFAWFDDNAELPSPDQELGLNNVVIAAVPEPSSVALGLVALGVAVAMLRLRRKSA